MNVLMPGVACINKFFMSTANHTTKTQSGLLFSDFDTVIDGKQVYELPSIEEIRAYAQKELATFWEEYRRLLNPHVYKVDMSDGLYDLKQKLIRENKKQNDEEIKA